MAVEPSRDPLWPDAPRYGPDRPWPPYAFRPGHDPHPADHPEGHSRGAVHVPTHRTPEAWRGNGDYLHAIDLYHRGYFWEAHEYWEGLWRETDKTSPIGRLYRGLIQLAAAELKRAVANPRGAETLSRRADENFAGLPGKYMGLDIGRLRADIARRFHGGGESPPPVRLVLRDEAPAAR